MAVILISAVEVWEIAHLNMASMRELLGMTPLRRSMASRSSWLMEMLTLALFKPFELL